MKGDAIHLSVTLKPSIELCSPFQYSVRLPDTHTTLRCACV